MDKKEVLQAFQTYQQLENLVYETTREYCKKIGKSILIDTDVAFQLDGEEVDVQWETFTMGNTDYDSISFPAKFLWEGVT